MPVSVDLMRPPSDACRNTVSEYQVNPDFSTMSSSPFEAAASPGGRVVIPAPAVTPPPFPSEVREPLLTPRISSYRSQSMQPPSSWEAGTHMVKSILGVALLALPRVFSMLGIGAGSICLAAVALLAYASLHALAKASARTGVMNMSVLAREELGVTGQAVLDMALIFNCFGAWGRARRGAKGEQSALHASSSCLDCCCPWMHSRKEV